MNLIPINEGNEQCQRCKHFYHAYGCMPTYVYMRPPCGRKVEGDMEKSMRQINNAYHMVFRDMILHGPDLFRGVYDVTNGNQDFMSGIQIVMEYIANRDNEGTHNKFVDMFAENIVRSQEKGWKSEL